MTKEEWLEIGLSKNLIDDVPPSAETLETLYPKWLAFKALHTDSTSSIRRIHDDWKKYYSGDDIIKMSVSALTKVYLDEWAHGYVRNFEMTKKQYFNFSLIIRQTLDYAVDLKLIQSNPMREVKINSKLFRVVEKKPDATQVYLIEEQAAVETLAFDDFLQSGSTACLAVALAFQLGCRVGEIVALKWSDVDRNKKNFISISRMEVIIHKQLEDGTFVRSGFKVVDHPKSDCGNRDLYLSMKARKLLSLVAQKNVVYGYSDSPYIFIHPDGNRIHCAALDCRVRKYCRHLDISEKSMHKIRKTYISTLVDAPDININTARIMAGHASEVTTLHNYTFNRFTEAETQERIERALTAGLQLIG